MDEKQIQQKYIELQIIEQQMKQYQQELLTLQVQLQELVSLEESLKSIESSKNNKILTTLSPGVFVKTELKNAKEVLMNVGSGVVVPKTTKETLDITKDQILKIQAMAHKLEQDLQLFVQHAVSLQKELQQALSKK